MSIPSTMYLFRICFEKRSFAGDASSFPVVATAKTTTKQILSQLSMVKGPVRFKQFLFMHIFDSYLKKFKQINIQDKKKQVYQPLDELNAVCRLSYRTIIISWVSKINNRLLFEMCRTFQ